MKRFYIINKIYNFGTRDCKHYDIIGKPTQEQVDNLIISLKKRYKEVLDYTHTSKYTGEIYGFIAVDYKKYHKGE